MNLINFLAASAGSFIVVSVVSISTYFQAKRTKNWREHNKFLDAELEKCIQTLEKANGMLDGLTKERDEWMERAFIAESGLQAARHALRHFGVTMEIAGAIDPAERKNMS